MDCHTCSNQLGSNLECTACLQFANSCVLLLRPMDRISGEDNQKSVFTLSDYDNSVINYFVHELDLKQLHLYVKRYEAFGALLRLGYLKKVVQERPSIIENGVESENFAKWKKEDRYKNAPKAEKRQLSDYDKAVAYLTKLGIPEEEAQRSVKEQFAKQGKVTQ